MPRILCFDYGHKRTGVAVTDPLQIIATSLPTIETKLLKDFVKEYCFREDVEAFVVGYPFAHGHSQNEVTVHIDAFIDELGKLFPDKKVYKTDESFTSKMASQTLIQSGVNKKERRKKGNLDAISANIILQSFLEMRANKR